jgi:hypothetical protein
MIAFCHLPSARSADALWGRRIPVEYGLRLLYFLISV